MHQAFSDVLLLDTIFDCSPYLSTEPWSVDRANWDDTVARMFLPSSSVTKSAKVATQGPSAISFVRSGSPPGLL